MASCYDARIVIISAYVPVRESRLDACGAPRSGRAGIREPHPQRSLATTDRSQARARLRFRFGLAERACSSALLGRSRVVEAVAQTGPQSGASIGRGTTVVGSALGDRFYGTAALK